MNPPNDVGQLASGLVRVEARLIRQEHRPRAALRNFMARKQWPAGDPRRRACWQALIWAWFGPTTVALGAAATLVALIWQNRLMAHQLNTMDTQFMLAEKANREAERTQLIGVLWDVKVDITTKEKVPVASPRTRKEALLRFVELERERFEEKEDPHDWSTYPIDLSGAQLSDIFAPGLILGNMSQISLKGADLRGADLRGAHLEGAILFEAHLEGADLSEAHFEGAILFEAHLEGADLSKAHFEGANLRFAQLEGAYLGYTHLEGARLWPFGLKGARLHRPYLEGAIVGDQHPSWLDEEDWTTVPIESDRPAVQKWEIRRRVATPPVEGGP